MENIIETIEVGASTSIKKEPKIKHNLPTHCPECGEELIWKGVDLVCANPNCDGKIANKLRRLITVIGCNDVKGVGYALVTDMIDLVTKDAPSSAIEYMKSSIFNMRQILKSTLIEDTYGSATAKKYRSVFTNIVENAIDKSLFLYAMNIPGLGWKTCQAIVSEGIFDKIIKDEEYVGQLNKIKGIGWSVISAVLNNDEYIRTMAGLLDNNFIEETEKDASLLTPTKFVTVTGSLSISRTKFDELIRLYGWGVDSNIRNSEYLVTNNPDPTSAKGKKAKELGKTIVTELEFYDIIGVHQNA